MKTWEDPSPDKNRNQHWQNFPQKWQNAPRKTDKLQTTMLWRSVKNSTDKIIWCTKLWREDTMLSDCKVIFHLSWCASLAIMLYVIRHAVNAKSVENYFLTRWVEIDTLDQDIKEYYSCVHLFLSTVRIPINLMLIDYIVLKQETP